MQNNRSIKVAFQGEHGAFSEDAARQLLGSDAQTVPCRTFEEMFDSVTSGAAHAAVAPIENSLAGSVHKNYDLLMAHDLTIIGETNVRIVLNLIARRGVTMEDIRRVHSHPVALAQCEKFLRPHRNIEVAPAYDTAGSVKMVIESDSKEHAAIAGATAASVYGAEIIAKGIEDNPQNFTRFLLLTLADTAASIETISGKTQRKTSIVFRVANKPGGLFRSLAAFALRDIDLAKIESRPIEGRPWEYSFYLDFFGDRDDPAVQRALSNLAELAESVKILGSYWRSD
jgi:prephenate dehydratase